MLYEWRGKEALIHIPCIADRLHGSSLYMTLAWRRNFNQWRRTIPEVGVTLHRQCSGPSHQTVRHTPQSNKRNGKGVTDHRAVFANTHWSNWRRSCLGRRLRLTRRQYKTRQLKTGNGAMLNSYVRLDVMPFI